MVPTSCDFCGKDRKDVVKLIISNKNAICDECIIRCSEVLHKSQNTLIQTEGTYSKFINPVLIKNFLDDYVIGQEQAKKSLSVSVANHYKRVFFKTPLSIEKSNCILLGPTGTGKSLLCRTIAKFLNVPFAIVDATNLTEAGYVGDDVEMVISRLLQNANEDIEKAQHGIVFIDEIDKIAKKNKGSIAQTAGGEGVQAALLKMVEGSIVTVPIGGKKFPGSQTVDIDTTNILFIVSGAFDGFQDIIDTRTHQKKIGFQNGMNHNVDIDVHGIHPDDFINYGLIPEFIGRFPIFVSTKVLKQVELYEVLTSIKNNLIDQYKFYFDVDNIELDFSADALEFIAEEAFKLKTGARALRAILDKHLQPLIFKIPEYKKASIVKIIISKDFFEKEHLIDLIITEGTLRYVTK